MNLGDFLNTLASKIGAQQDPGLIDLLSSSELASYEINDELATKLDRGLMSLEGAKNNIEVAKFHKAQNLGSADAKFAALAAKYGIVDEIANEKSTYNKFDILEKRIAELVSEAESKVNAASGSKSEEVNKLNQQLAALQKQFTELTATKDKEIAAMKAANAKQQLDMLVNFELNGKQYANQELGETNVTIARALLDNALKAHNAVLVNDNGTIRMKQAENTNLDVLDASNVPMTFADFTTKLLADKHMLSVSGGETQHNYTPSNEQGYTPVDNTAFSGSVASSLADLS